MSLLASLRTTAGALRAFEQALETTQNNVANASTPGYARQRADLVALPFSPVDGLPGGVAARPPRSERDPYMEQNVRRQLEAEGRHAARAELLAGIESAFDISGETGIPGALNRLFASFSAWAFAPNDSNARQAVLDRARDLGQNFRDAAALVEGVAEDSGLRLAQTVDQINQLAADLADFNGRRRSGDRDDGGLEARMYTALEQMSELVGVSVLQAGDGALTVLAGGRVPLVVGGHVYPLELAARTVKDPLYPNGAPHVAVLDSGGAEVTGKLDSGRLGGLLQVRNETVPNLLGDGSRQGELNRLAQAVAQRVNALLAAGETDAGTAPSMDLFLLDPDDPTAAASSLRLNEDLPAGELAAADPGPPYGSNGTALKLAALNRPQAAEDMLDGVPYPVFFAGLASGLGRELERARQDQDLAVQTTAQARSLRQTFSGVSLDQEAITMTQIQRGYQAAAKIISVLDEMTEVTVNLLR
ncbi:MAG: flagellar hook-associated protein FlgK [Bryobacteraceae bacterium]